MITVLLCSYNGAHYIEAQLTSILQQSVPDLRVVVSDDGSTDDTIAIVERMMKQYPGRITRLLQNPPTGSAQAHFLKLLADHAYDLPANERGPQPDRSAVLHAEMTEGGPDDRKLSRTDYIMLSDQDDVWYPDKAEKCRRRMQELEKQSRAAGEGDVPLLVHCDSQVVDSSLHKISPSYAAYQKMTPARCKLSQLLVQNNVVGGAILMNRALAECITAVPAHCVMHDQWIALIAAAFGHIAFLPEALYMYRQHGSNVLGAEKGSRVMEVLGRFGIGRRDGKTKAEMDEHSRRVYREMFLQAACFRSMYEERLSEEQKDLLDQFISIPQRSRLGKIRTILRFGFTYNLFHRTVGECLFIQ